MCQKCVEIGTRARIRFDKHFISGYVETLRWYIACRALLKIIEFTPSFHRCNCTSKITEGTPGTLVCSLVLNACLLICFCDPFAQQLYTYIQNHLKLSCRSKETSFLSLSHFYYYYYYYRYHYYHYFCYHYYYYYFL